MKLSRLIFAGALALLALTACKKEETPDNGDDTPSGTEYDEAYYAANATVTSSDSEFSATEEGGAISFTAEGGSVTLNVSCGAAWTVSGDGVDWLDYSLDGNAVIVVADPNADENELSGSFTFTTSGKGILFATVTVTQAAYGTPEISVQTNEVGLPAVGELTVEVGVESSLDEYEAGSDADWLTVEKTDTGVSITAEENGETSARTADVVVTCSNGHHSASATVTVTQDGRAYISLESTVAAFGPDASSAEVAVESNYEWGYSYDASNGWFSVESGDGVLIVTVTDNESGDSREGEVVLTAGDGAENVAEATLTVSQSMYETDAMVFTVNVSAGGETVTLPLTGTVNCDVNWGDGSDIEAVTSATPTHVYGAGGDYTVSVTGTVTGLSSADFATSGSPDYHIISFDQWGDTGITSFSKAFYNCKGLTTVSASTAGKTLGCTDASNAFYSCTALTSVSADIFAGFSAVTTFASAFYGCTSLTSLPEGLFDSCPNVTTFNMTFFNAGLTSVPADLFAGHSELTTLSNALTGTKITTVPEGFLSDLPALTDIASLFNACTALETIPSGLFDSCVGCTNLTNLFYSCSSLKEIPAGLFDKLTSVTAVANTFNGCSSLTEIPAGLFDSFTEVDRYTSAFQGCTGLTSIPENLFAASTKVKLWGNTFSGCVNLTGESAYDIVDGTKIHLYERSSHTDVYTAPTTTSGCYKNCALLSDYSSMSSSWK